jgi:hypothetical protein
VQKQGNGTIGDSCWQEDAACSQQD